MTYLNLKTVHGVETVDQLDQKDFLGKVDTFDGGSIEYISWREFRKELNRLIREYHLAGMPVYASQRCSKDWK